MYLNNIKNVIFDLGAVLFTIDYSLTIKSFEALGIHDFTSFFSKKRQDSIFDQYELGAVSTSQFLKRIKEYLPESTSNNDIVKAWNAMLLKFPQSSIELLKGLRPNYRLFLLSNTNALHFSSFHDIIYKQHGISDLERFFEKVYYSHLIGMRKPDKKVFEYVLEENDLVPSETLFIDDSPQHVKGAKETGIHGKLLEKESAVLNLFSADYKIAIQ
ncbi:MAG TPA: HAD family phosphatase [Flavobacteriales bacterium]|nr:HAD family phosphatase [Flavobacteriales bacterium]HIN39777.1 HAD family phosphatase [Flavobacteriales bacterium]